MIEHIIKKLKERRQTVGISTDELNERLTLGAGWIDSFESNNTNPTIDFIFAVARSLDLSPQELFSEIKFKSASDVLSHQIELEDAKIDEENGAIIKFRYNSYLSEIFIPSASKDTFDLVVEKFRNDLNHGSKAKAVVDAFQNLIAAWPRANPSDIWWFIMSRLYSDRYLHPVTEIHRDFGQSWKRTAGWALEQIVVENYRDYLAQHQIEIGIFGRSEKEELLSGMQLNYHVEANKADVLLVDVSGSKRSCFGVAHVKASIAERRQNDQNFSKALLEKNFFSPFVTMDCKSSPSTKPINKGEFGNVMKIGEVDNRRDKRKEFENEGYYSGCYSFNSNTQPTPDGQMASSRISVVNFVNPDDAFSKATIRVRDLLFGK